MVNSHESGYVALLTVLIVGAAATSIALVLLTSGTNSQRAMLIEKQSKQARALATACTQEALQQIHDNVAYSGTSTLTLGQGGCSYTVTITSGVVRGIVATGTVGGVIKKIQASVTIGASVISITAWQEIS